MNTQIQQLEDSVTRLVERFHAVVAANRELTAEVRRLKQEQQKLLDHFQQEKEALYQRYETKTASIVQDMQHTVDALQAQNRKYEARLTESSQALQALLQRFPTIEEEAL